jgi:DnaJ-class molecular chaperone
MSTETPFQILGLEETATEQEVIDRFRGMALLSHPDKGGTALGFMRIKVARDQALALIRAPKPCLACNGTGRKQVVNGFTSVTLYCETCQGSGKQS